MPNVKFDKPIEKIFRNKNQYGVRKLGERDYARAQQMIAYIEPFPTFDVMMENLKQYRPHKITEYGDDRYSVDLGPQKRMHLRRTRHPNEVEVVYIGDHHRRGSRR